MHDGDRRDNGQRFEATPVHDVKKKSKIPIILAFAGGILAAALVLSVFTSVGVSRPSQALNAVNLVPIVTTDANYMRFGTGEVSSISVTALNGSVDIRMHGENFISVRGTAGATHEASDGAITLNSRNGSFTILLPEIVLDMLDVDARNGRVEISGAANNNTVLAENLNVQTRNGGISVSDLAVPGNLELETRNGSINVRNVLSDEGNTRLHTRNGSINADE